MQKFLAYINSFPPQYLTLLLKYFEGYHKFQESIWEVEIQYLKMLMMVKLLEPKSMMVKLVNNKLMYEV